jgi:hypothetical protein
MVVVVLKERSGWISPTRFATMSYQPGERITVILALFELIYTIIIAPPVLYTKTREKRGADEEN